MVTSLELFSSKVLLFGEYGVLLGAKALSIPYSRFSGVFKYDAFGTVEGLKSNRMLQGLLDYMAENECISQKYNLNDFQKKLEEGLWFDSTIPNGYGLGSSGAVCAAVYDSFAKEKVVRRSDVLMGDLAQLESFFHGKSSGIDPLVSYLKRPILVMDGEVQIVDVDVSFVDSLNLFIVDSKQQRNSSTLIESFIDFVQKPQNQSVKDCFLELTNRCVDSFLNKDKQGVLGDFISISNFQINFMESLIPESINSIWRDGLSTGAFTLKLCGAGGGGFILGITSNWDVVNAQFVQRGFPIYPIK